VHLAYDIAYEVGFEDMVRRVPDVTKVATMTGWRAERVLDQILDDVIAEVRNEALPSTLKGQ
jgi:UDP-glucose 4-epimerase